jgi:hypothetical protein
MVSDEAPLVRRFVLSSDESARQLFEVLRRRKEMAASGRHIQVVVSTYAPNRRRDQNSKMWVGYLEPIAQQARVNKASIRAEDWHLVLKAMFLPEVCARGIHKWTYKDNGDRELTMSTGDLNEDEFEVYLHEIGSYATNDLGVRLPANPRDLQGSPYEEPKA